MTITIHTGSPGSRGNWEGEGMTGARGPGDRLGVERSQVEVVVEIVGAVGAGHNGGASRSERPVSVRNTSSSDGWAMCSEPTLTPPSSSTRISGMTDLDFYCY